MTSQSVRLFLILVGVAVCLTVATSGEGAGNNEVLSDPANNLMEDAIKFNIIKKEAIPEARREKNRERNQNNGKRPKGKNVNKTKGKNGNRPKGKNGHKTERKNGNRARRRNRHKTKGKNGNRPKGKNGKPQRRNKKNGQKKGNQRRVKVRNGKGNNGGGKGSKRGKKKGGNATKGKWGRKNKNSQNVNADPRQLLCATGPEVAKTISTGIISYRKYFNHLKKITRTKNDLEKLIRKSDPSKLAPYMTAADSLKSVTNGGTNCPADNTPENIQKVTEAVAKLTTCGIPATSLVTVKCKKDLIPGFENLDQLDVCEVEYPPWIAAFKVCFEAAVPDCTSCFLPLNQDPSVPPVSNDPDFSCQKPNTGGNDWIIKFNTETTAVLRDCKAEVGACKDEITEALQLAATCCKSDTAAITTGGGRRRISLINQALLKSQFKKINLH